ncbi:MAG: LysM domain-containing protein [Chlamydiales bacterium]|nr:LysM domain-containing protein [Chlamydiales bacterium]
MTFNETYFSYLPTKENSPSILFDKENGFVIACDLVSKSEIDKAVKALLIKTVLEAIEARLLSFKKNTISTELLKEALLFANVKLLQKITHPLKVALSALVIAKSKERIVIAGIGDLHLYTKEFGITESVFKDPLNANFVKNLSSCERYNSLKNALGTNFPPYFHVKQINRSHLKKLILVSYGIYEQYGPERLFTSTLEELKATSPKEHDLLYCSLELEESPTLPEKVKTKRSKIPLIAASSSISIIIAFLASNTLPIRHPHMQEKHTPTIGFFKKSQEKILVDNPTNDFQENITSLKDHLMEKETALHALLQEKEGLTTQHIQEISILKNEVERQSAIALALQSELLALKPPKLSEKPSAVRRIHIVSQGDSLSSISQKYYGTPKRWEEIYNANKEVLASQDHIKAGMQLMIPK